MYSALLLVNYVSYLVCLLRLLILSYLFRYAPSKSFVSLICLMYDNALLKLFLQLFFTFPALFAVGEGILKLLLFHDVLLGIFTNCIETGTQLFEHLDLDA